MPYVPSPIFSIFWNCSMLLPFLIKRKLLSHPINTSPYEHASQDHHCRQPTSTTYMPYSIVLPLFHFSLSRHFHNSSLLLAVFKSAALPDNASCLYAQSRPRMPFLIGWISHVTKTSNENMGWHLSAQQPYIGGAWFEFFLNKNNFHSTALLHKKIIYWLKLLIKKCIAGY